MPTIVRRFGFEKTTSAKPLDKDRVLMQKGGLYRYFCQFVSILALEKQPKSSNWRGPYRGVTRSALRFSTPRVLDRIFGFDLAAEHQGQMKLIDVVPTA